MVEFKNPNYMETCYSFDNYAFGNKEEKKLFLERKSEILSQINKNIIIGLGYTSYSTKTFTGRFPYENDEYVYINEYIIVSIDYDESLDKSNLAYMPLCDTTFYAQTEEGMGGVYDAYIYEKELNELGYICLPDNFKELEDDAIRGLFEINKSKTK